ncbi:PREDICTED: probable xyloglucan endotransglucosylase/hydrolase protein 33 [Nelumbo nucifera]|uniref:Xyloglucan endotransglucosylase/hydrolase n=1 Tax=Nelumbo nucifera TaxID=4432 RepID=A0A1U8AVE6_NELNU|nr:PREDICTED: probable xyloglucan endotransglucosylase/hydrolase protein 33 [Nelumbo nucifera]
MSRFPGELLRAGIFISCFVFVLSSSRNVNYTPSNLTHLTDLFPHRTFAQGFSEFFGGPNIQLTNNGSYVNLMLNKSSGSGFVSRDRYKYGFFSTAIKLPSGYTSGVVVAFYMSNADNFPHTHDEIDFELLGHEKRKEWILQTNLYGNGSTGTGREEKFRLWFDPTEEFHQYSIIWNDYHIVFLVDNIPVREVNHSQAISSIYPSKAMSVYATIWDGSQWATHGGKYPVNYKFEPFVASFGEMEMEGCILDPTTSVASCPESGLSIDPVQGEAFAKLSQQQNMGMEWARKRFMFYSYCKDAARFKVLPPECNGAK